MKTRYKILIVIAIVLIILFVPHLGQLQSQSNDDDSDPIHFAYSA